MGRRRVYGLGNFTGQAIEQIRQGPFTSQAKKSSHSKHNFDLNFFALLQKGELIIRYRCSESFARSAGLLVSLAN